MKVPHDSFCFDSQMSKLMFYDDFLGRTLLDEWLLTVVATGAGALQDGQDSGVYRLSAATNATVDESRIDWNNLRSLTVAKKACMEVRCTLNSAVYLSVYILLYYDASNYIGFRFSEAVGGAINWTIVCRSAGVETPADSGVAVGVAAGIFRIEAHTHGGNHVHFYVGGVEVAGSPVSANVPVSYFQPYLRVVTNAVAVKQLDIDYVVVTQDR